MARQWPNNRFLRSLRGVLEFEGSLLASWPASARERVIVAATQRLLERPLSTISNGIKISKLALVDDNGETQYVGRRASRKGATADDLTKWTLLRSLDPDRPGSTPDILAWGLDALANGEDSVSVIYEVISRGYFDFFQANEHMMILKMFGWLAGHESTELADAYRQQQQRVHAAVTEGLEFMMDRDNRTPVAGMTREHLATICVGMVEGTMLGIHFEQTSLNGEQLAAAAASILATLTQPADSPTTNPKARVRRVWELKTREP